MNKTIIIKTFLGILLILSLSISSYPALVANWRECLAAPGCTCGISPDIKKSMGPSLQTYIAESAWYFLTSHADYQDFQALVEMTDINGVDSQGMKTILDSAIANMEKARAAYANLKVAAADIPNDKAMMDRLRVFDYDGFQAKFGLLGPICEKVKALLIKGDTAGLDDAVLANMDAILKQLYEVKTIVDGDRSPDIAILWRLNQSYFEAQLFGQYMSEIIKANI
ncbi:MAG: hypothetical protein NT166_32455 [Candidatus Aminicenantes bacterium]|nr:hypothetical protein [Candidatus Aminicenantes bacterium]